MSSKKHITALGKQFDMASMRAQNEHVRAVGNMNVNARGDIIDSNNNIIQDRNKRVNIMYERTMQNRAKPDNRVRNASPASINEADVSRSELDDLDDNMPNPQK
jgi:hypothetical protein